MDFVVTKKEVNRGVEMTLYYAGYQAASFAESGPIFNRTITRRARLDERTADMAIKQLTELGHEVAKRPIAERKLRPGGKKLLRRKTK